MHRLWHRYRCGRTKTPFFVNIDIGVHIRTCVFSIKFDRTDRILGVSRAKHCGESAGDVRFDVAPRKPDKNAEKRLVKTDKASNFLVRRLNASELVETRPTASKQ